MKSFLTLTGAPIQGLAKPYMLGSLPSDYAKDKSEDPIQPKLSIQPFAWLEPKHLKQVKERKC
ncbi:MAG: hypothetical protein ACD_16C00144G0003 [uncultured bacterium]|nr:MAG: hypothetical protein ACD_16C00144G0003 [uncultured bacterium]HBG34405.1 hypothetical protein [Holosporales bacterium]HBW24172.1 hypothetical protein [Holosporales bacterium]HCC24865.1 hypothetical protein [Holosporales bacterium]HCE96192.1 hypothetical protein [Holosporales bacterium]